MAFEHKTFTIAEIEQAKNTGTKITKTQDGKDAYEAVIKKFKNINPNDLFYYKGSGVWRRKTGVKKKVRCCKAPKNPEVKKPEKYARSIPSVENPKKIPLIPDVRPPEKDKLVPELKGGFNRGIKPKNRIELWSIEDVMRCTDKEIVGFLPIYKEGVKLS